MASLLWRKRPSGANRCLHASLTRAAPTPSTATPHPTRQVARNGAMGMDQASFVGAKFGLPPGVVRGAYKKMFSCSAITEDDFVLLVLLTHIFFPDLSDTLFYEPHDGPG